MLFLDYNKEIESYDRKRNQTTYTAYYKFWSNFLFERIMRLFYWKCDNISVDDRLISKEIEQRLHLKGFCFVGKFKKEITVFSGRFSGITKYYDEFPDISVHCPIHSETFRIDKKGVIIENTMLRNPTYYVCHHYATLLAHAQVTLCQQLINLRKGGVPVVKSDIQKSSIDNYNSNIYNGKFGTVTDLGFLGIDILNTNQKESSNIQDTIYVCERLYKSFLSDIGIKSSFEKKNNTVTSEVEADTRLLLLNLSDMLDSRQKSAEKLTKKFGCKFTVFKNPEIDIESDINLVTKTMENISNEN